MFKSPAVQGGFVNDCNKLFQALFNLGREDKLPEARKLINRHRTKYSNLFIVKEASSTEANLSGCPENAWTLESYTSGWESAMDESCDNNTTCAQCNVTFDSVVSLQEHQQNEHENENQHRCSTCHKIFKNRKYLNIHFRSVHGDKKFRCEFCGFLTTRKNVLDKHTETVHINGQILNCTKCIFTCFTRQELSEHMGAEHAIIYKCPECDQKFSRLDGRDYHYRLEHCTEKHHSCDLCGAKFSSDGSLRRHQKTVHEGVKSFSCKECHKQFTKSDALTAHISTIHFGEKPFNCPHCNKAFAQKGNLNRHIEVVHEGFKAFSCTHCDKGFSTRSELSQHVSVVHTKEKPHPCTQCEKIFFHKNLLRRHMKRRHPEALLEATNDPKPQPSSANRDSDTNTASNSNAASNANAANNANTVSNANTASYLNLAIQKDSPVNLNMNYMMTQQVLPYHLMTSGI